MDNSQQPALMPHEISKLILELPPKEIEQLILTLTPEQIGETVALLTEASDDHWQVKLNNIICAVQSKPHLETIGKHLNTWQLVEILSLVDDNTKKLIDKLDPILADVNITVFSQLLFLATNRHMQILKFEAVAQPIQHQLTLFLNDMEKQQELLLQSLERLQSIIDGLKPSDLMTDDAKDLVGKIEAAKEWLLSTLSKINKALAIAWNSSRIDLIERFSVLKETFQRILILFVGVPGTTSKNATGLYALLESRQEAVYGDPNVIGQGALRDDDPALEALAKLHVFYLEEYWELGLLNQFKSLNQLLDYLNVDDENEKIQRRKSLYCAANTLLEKAGLKNVSDVKRHKLFTKQAFKEYLLTHLAS